MCCCIFANPPYSKDWIWLLPAFAEVHRKLPRSILVLRAPGEEAFVGKLRKLSDDLKITDHVLWAGFPGRGGKLAALAAAAVFVCRPIRRIRDGRPRSTCSGCGDGHFGPGWNGPTGQRSGAGPGVPCEIPALTKALEDLMTNPALASGIEPQRAKLGHGTLFPAHDGERFGYNFTLQFLRGARPHDGWPHSTGPRDHRTKGLRTARQESCSPVVLWSCGLALAGYWLVLIYQLGRSGRFMSSIVTGGACRSCVDTAHKPTTAPLAGKSALANSRRAARPQDHRTTGLQDSCLAGPVVPWSCGPVVLLSEPAIIRPRASQEFERKVVPKRSPSCAGKSVPLAKLRPLWLNSLRSAGFVINSPPGPLSGPGFHREQPGPPRLL